MNFNYQHFSVKRFRQDLHCKNIKLSQFWNHNQATANFIFKNVETQKKVKTLMYFAYKSFTAMNIPQ